MKNFQRKETDRDFYRTTRLDLVFIGLILFVSIASFWVIHKRFQPSSGESAICIYQKDKLLEEDGLGKDKIIAIVAVAIIVVVGGVLLLNRQPSGTTANNVLTAPTAENSVTEPSGPPTKGAIPQNIIVPSQDDNSNKDIP